MLDKRSHHARRRLRPKGDSLASLIGKGIHLLLHDIGRFTSSLGEQFLSLDYWSPNFGVAIPNTDIGGDTLDVLPPADFRRKNVAGTADTGDHVEDLFPFIVSLLLSPCSRLHGAGISGSITFLHPRQTSRNQQRLQVSNDECPERPRNRAGNQRSLPRIAELTPSRHH